MARPSTRSINLKDGYYIELLRSGENKGIKVHRDSLDEIQRAISKYEPVYRVVFIGKIENGKVVEESSSGDSASKKEKKAKKAKQEA